MSNPKYFAKNRRVNWVNLKFFQLLFGFCSCFGFICLIIFMFMFCVCLFCHSPFWNTSKIHPIYLIFHCSYLEALLQILTFIIIKIMFTANPILGHACHYVNRLWSSGVFDLQRDIIAQDYRAEIIVIGLDIDQLFSNKWPLALCMKSDVRTCTQFV